MADALSPNDKLLQVCGERRDDCEKEISRLVRAGADVWYQEDVDGKSALMVAAGASNLDAVNALLEFGAPWRALDRKGVCAGEYALKLNTEEGQVIVNRLVNAGVQAELLYRALEKVRKETSNDAGNTTHLEDGDTKHVDHETTDIAKDAELKTMVKEDVGNNTLSEDGDAKNVERQNTDRMGTVEAKSMRESSRFYLSSEVRYEGGDLFDKDGRGVMMEWEKPLMEKHAEILCSEKNVDVLNIGFGCGYIDTAIQTHGVRSHTIIEAHPLVYKKMIADGWGEKANVKIVFGRWQDHIDKLGDFNSVYFDSFDDVADLDEFHHYLPKLVRMGGIYSYFNGVCPDNLFFQGVASELILHLMRERGFEGQFLPIQVRCTDAPGWKHALFRYFLQNNYYIPCFQRVKTVESSEFVWK